MKIWLVIFLFCILISAFFVTILVDGENNCQEYKMICYRREAVFLGVKDIETRCSNNNWDFQRKECVDFGYFWENNK